MKKLVKRFIFAWFLLLSILFLDSFLFPNLKAGIRKVLKKEINLNHLEDLSVLFSIEEETIPVDQEIPICQTVEKEDELYEVTLLDANIYSPIEGIVIEKYTDYLVIQRKNGNRITISCFDFVNVALYQKITKNQFLGTSKSNHKIMFSGMDDTIYELYQIFKNT